MCRDIFWYSNDFKKTCVNSGFIFTASFQKLLERSLGIRALKTHGSSPSQPGELRFVPECRNLPVSFAVVWYTLRVSFRAAVLFLLKSRSQWPKAPLSLAFSHGLIGVVVLGFSKRTPFLIAPAHVYISNAALWKLPRLLKMNVMFHLVYIELVSGQTTKEKANVLDSKRFNCFLAYSHTLT